MSASKPLGWLTSESNWFMVQSLLGQGSFGVVVKCLPSESKKPVAIKMIQMAGIYLKQADAEVAVLRKLQSLDPDKCNLVRWHQDFIDKDKRYRCLVFELLDKSLFDFMKEERKFQPLPVKEINYIIHQLTITLHYLKKIRVIHADIKPANIMLVNHQREPFRVKLIDFGLALVHSAATVGANVQSLPYRSPEICLGLPFTESIDMWSLGCVAAFLYLGKPLYLGKTPYDVIKCMVETQGQLPDNVLMRGIHTRTFFWSNDDKTLWKLKTPEQIYRETGKQPQLMNSLDSLDELYPVNKTGEETDIVTKFVDMLKEMLQLDATARISPRKLLEQPYFRTSCSPSTDVCQNEKVFADSIQKNPARVEPNSKHKPPPSHDNPHPGTNTQAARITMSGMKRQANDEGTTQTIEGLTSHSNRHNITGPRIRISHYAKRKMTDDAVTEHKKTKIDLPDKSNDRSGSQKKDIDQNMKQGGDGGTAPHRIAKTTQKNLAHGEPRSKFQPHRFKPRHCTGTHGGERAITRPAAASHSVPRKIPGTDDTGCEKLAVRKMIQQTSVNSSTSGSTGQTQRKGIVCATDSNLGHKWEAPRSTRTPQPHCPSRGCPEGSRGAERLPLMGLKRKSADHGDKLPVKRTCADTSSSTFNSTLPAIVSAGWKLLSSCKNSEAPSCANKVARKNVRKTNTNKPKWVKNIQAIMKWAAWQQRAHF